MTNDPAAGKARRASGPGFLVAAAFIGPGTITTASVAGAQAGLGLVWALGFSVVATMVLQEMAARLGLVARLGLSEALRSVITRPVPRALVLGLVILAIGVGNAAYEAGNIVGATLGAAALLPIPQWQLVLVVGVISAGLLYTGRYALLERVLVALVLLMAIVFLACVVVAPPSVDLWLDAPWWPPGATLTAIALVGTTVVPYNLFLHASAVQARWDASVPLERALVEARRDAIGAIGIGGVLTLAVMSTSAVAFFGTDADVTGATMAQQLEPVLGRFAGVAFAIGLLAAGLTSAITAPLAAAWAVTGALGARSDLRAPGFRAVWAVVLASGVVVALLQTRPIAVIVLAQAANGLLLPIVAGLLLWIMNRPSLLGAQRNGARTNLWAGLVLMLVALLGLDRLRSALASVF